MSPEFEVVTGTLETMVEVANWQKVKVTVGSEVLVGWIDTNATASEEDQQDTDQPVIVAGDQLSLGVNEVFRDPLLKAEEITKIDAAALAALIDAEAAKVNSGANAGQWDPKSFNADSDAAGLTQFLQSTWLGHAREFDHSPQQGREREGAGDGSRRRRRHARGGTPQTSVRSGAVDRVGGRVRGQQSAGSRECRADPGRDRRR